MFRIVIIVLLFPVSASISHDRIHYPSPIDTWNKRTANWDWLNKSYHFNWYDELDSSQVNDVVDSLRILAKQIYPFREGEYNEWETELFDVIYQGIPRFAYLGSIVSSDPFGIFLEKAPEIPLTSEQQDSANRTYSEGFGRSNIKTEWTRGWPEYPNPLNKVTWEEIDEECYQISFSAGDDTTNSFSVEDLKKAIENLSSSKGLVLDLRSMPNLSNTDVNRFVGLFLSSQTLGVIKERRDLNTGLVTVEQDTINPDKKSYDEPLVVILGYALAGHLISASLEGRPRTAIIETASHHNSLVRQPMVDFGEPYLLQHGVQARIPTTVYRKPQSLKIASEYTHTGIFVACDMSNSYFAYLKECKEKPLKELKRLIHQKRSEKYLGL